MIKLYRSWYEDGEVKVTESKLHGENEQYYFVNNKTTKVSKESLGTVVGKPNGKKRVYSEDKYFAVAAMCDYIVNQIESRKKETELMNRAVKNCIYGGAVEK